MKLIRESFDQLTMPGQLSLFLGVIDVEMHIQRTLELKAGLAYDAR